MPPAALLPPPEELRSLTPYLQRAAELQEREPVIAYYCKYYAAKMAIARGVNKANKEATAYLITLMDQLEEEKKTMAGNEAITNDVVGYAHVENFALKVFINADNEDRAGRANMNTVRKFLAAAIFLELLGVFGEVESQVSEKIRYCKWKAVDITKALKEGRQPTAGPPGGPEGAPGEFDAIAGSSNVPRMSIGGGTSASSSSSPPAYGSPDVTRPNASSPSAPPPAAITPPLVPPPISQTPQHIHARVESAPATSSSSSSFAAQVPGSFLDPKISTEIQKHCRYTISALQYDDLKTAAQNLEKALELLRPHLNK